MTASVGTNSASIPRARGQRAIAREVARIPREVLGRPELERVDEDAHHDAVGPPARLVHQPEVSLVEEAHRGHERNAAARRALLAHPARAGRQSC